MPIHQLQPIIVDANGTTLPLTTDSISFQGRELYGLKTIRLGNPLFSIAPAYATIDMQRYPDGATINVVLSRAVATWEWNFTPPKNSRTGRPVPTNVTLVNTVTGETRQFNGITKPLHEKIPGNEGDWRMSVDTDQHEANKLVPNCRNLTQFLKRKATPITPGPTPGPTPDPTPIEIPVDPKPGPGPKQKPKPKSWYLRLFEEKKLKIFNYGLVLLGVVAAVLIGVWITDIVKKSNWKEQTVELAHNDGSIISKEDARDLRIEIDNTDSIKPKPNSDCAHWTLSYDPDFKGSVKITVSIGKDDDNLAILYSKTYRVDEIPEKINLPLRTIELSWYKQIVDNQEKPEDFDTLIRYLENGDEYQRNYATLLKRQLKAPSDMEQSTFPYQGDNPTSDANNGADNKNDNKNDKGSTLADKTGATDGSNKSDGKADKNADDGQAKKETSATYINWKELDKPRVTLSRISQIENEAEAKGIGIPAEYKTRIAALRRVISDLQNAMRPNTKGLSDEQTNFIKNVWDPFLPKNSFPNQKNLFKNIQSIAGCAPVVTKAKKAEGMK